MIVSMTCCTTLNSALQQKGYRERNRSSAIIYIQDASQCPEPRNYVMRPRRRRPSPLVQSQRCTFTKTVCFMYLVWFLCVELAWVSTPTSSLLSQMVEAKCVVQYPKESNEPPLSLKVLPYGVNYYKEEDRLECIRPGSCSRYSISNCKRVDCLNHNSCEEALLVNNGEVICFSNNACQRADIQDGHSVICGGSLTDPFCASGKCGTVGDYDHDHFCPHAVIETDGIVNCVGPKACTAHEEKVDAVTVRVGNLGVVHCTNAQDLEYSCSHMVIEIDHGRRACFTRTLPSEENPAPPEPHQKCAVHCQNTHDCDMRTMQFRIIGT